MSALLPALSVLFAVLATAVPWGLPADATFVLPLVVVMMVFCWRALPGATLLPTVAMLLGLLTDVMSGGPLGFWALLSLIASGAGTRARPLGEGGEMSLLWLVWIVLAVGLTAFGWLLASLYFLRWVDWWPIAFSAVVSMALFPIVLHGVIWIGRGRLGPSRSATYRGRA
jgi:rod shape-determining protein MreD